MEHWIGRRSEIYSTRGVCASSQPYASAVGARILENGGSAADACVAMAAALNLTEPCSTGIGGDAFALYFDAKTKKVQSIQGNGRASAKTTLESLNERGIGFGEGLKPWNPRSGLCVTVPGAAGLWETLVETFGKMKLEDVLQPAIKLAEDGFPIAPITAKQWSEGYLQGEEANRVLRPNDQSVSAGQIFKNPDLANTFRLLGKLGAKQGFYSGPVAEAIVQAVQAFGGDLTLDDLANHETMKEEPISTVYKGIRVFQTPPPSHGLAVLLTLNLIQQLEASSSTLLLPKPQQIELKEEVCKHHQLTATQVHHNILAMRHGFADALQFISDPLHPAYTGTCPVDTLLSEAYTEQRVQSMLSMAKDGSRAVYPGDLTAFIAGETVYFCCVDAEGNACSMINSNYMGFGTGIIPTNTGFTLHNRGYNFSLQPGHPNQIQPNKRPYHTIIPGLATYEEDGNLYGVFGNMVSQYQCIFALMFHNIFICCILGWIYATYGTCSTSSSLT